MPIFECRLGLGCARIAGEDDPELRPEGPTPAIPEAVIYFIN